MMNYLSLAESMRCYRHYGAIAEALFFIASKGTKMAGIAEKTEAPLGRLQTIDRQIFL